MSKTFLPHDTSYIIPYIVSSCISSNLSRRFESIYQSKIKTPPSVSSEFTSAFAS
ncbi:MAG: hypothetical protein AAFO15_00490 [Pseudomonadota bacterium]